MKLLDPSIYLYSIGSNPNGSLSVTGFENVSNNILIVFIGVLKF